MIHPLADVQSSQIGENTTIWQFAVVLKKAVIGENCNINCHTFIENDVVIGNHVTVKSGVFLWDGIYIENNVFIGPNATFVNDQFPKSKQYPTEFQKTILREGCSIGANATILGGIEIGSNALIGAGSVVTKNVKPHALMLGNPAKQVAWVNNRGEKLKEIPSGLLTDSQGNKFEIIDNFLVQK
ncbi:MAG: acyltransferase [Bacteroidota bacterium]|nr:acyltransferase [Bacteroidota bacterium]